MDYYSEQTQRKRASVTGPAIAAVLLFALALGALGTVLTLFARSALIKNEENRMREISSVMAAQIDGDTLASFTTEDVETDKYQTFMKHLRTIGNSNSASYTYFIRKSGDSFIITVDASMEDPAEFGEEAYATSELISAFKGEASVEYYENGEWGNFCTVYNPIYTSDGKISDVLALDFYTHDLDAQVNRLILFAACIGGGALFVGIVFAVVTAHTVNKRFRRLEQQLY